MLSFSDVRLVGGSSSNRGRLEIYGQNRYGTFCPTGFGQTAADIVCRQLGYVSAQSWGTVGSLG